MKLRFWRKYSYRWQHGEEYDGEVFGGAGTESPEDVGTTPARDGVRELSLQYGKGVI